MRGVLLFAESVRRLAVQAEVDGERRHRIHASDVIDRQ
jgi:hypothetical protein